YNNNFEEFQGILNTSIKIENTLAEPDLKAEMTIEDGRIKSSRYGLDYRDIEFELLADEHILNLVHLSTSTGKKGVMSMQGQVNYLLSEKDINLEDFRLQFTARDFQAIRNRDIDLLLNADIQLEGDQEKIDLAGDILIKKARIFLESLLSGKSSQQDLPVPLLVQAIDSTDSQQANLPETAGRKASLPEKLQGRIRVVFPRNTWILSPELNMELNGQLDLVKSGIDYEIFGEVGVRRGSYSAYGRRFEIRQGNLYFSGGKEINPGLEIRAEYTFRDQRAEKRKLILIITGNVLTPIISFFLEDNPLTEADAISYLIFGKSSDELTSGERSQLGPGSGEGMALNFLARRMTSTLTTALQNHLRLDVVEFNGDSDWRQATIILGKYITNDLYLSYQREFSFGQSREIIPEQVSLEYELSRHFYLQATHGGEKATGFDLIWKFEK
ncbi:MAG: translocation/assembly module TamB, partial [Candidatus Cloacimonetes bacterium]|nr:translocation/assembly module TamB [Candidatus Cloacimonadota bacterium]